MKLWTQHGGGCEKNHQRGHLRTTHSTCIRCREPCGVQIIRQRISFYDLQFPLQDGLSSEVTVTNHPENQGEQAGLIWFHDEANYIKLVKESLEGSEWIVLGGNRMIAPSLLPGFQSLQNPRGCDYPCQDKPSWDGLNPMGGFLGKNWRMRAGK